METINLQCNSPSQIIRVFGCTYVPICNAASDWPHTFFTPRVFLFSIRIYYQLITDNKAFSAAILTL